MIGHLHLIFSEGGGRTYLSGQSFRAPMHLSKPHWDGHYLIVNAVNPTAGLFSGDVVEIKARAEIGASGLLTSPSASRVYQARPEMPATRLRQEIAVEAGAWLEVMPELLIPQKGARLDQETRIEVAEGGELLFLESVAPGRVASGESFAFESLCWSSELRVDGKLLAIERARLSPEDDSLVPLRTRFPESYYAGGYWVSPRAAGDLPEAVAALGSADVVAGASSLGSGVFGLKILASGSIALRKALAALRAEIYARASRPEPLHRKL